MTERKIYLNRTSTFFQYCNISFLLFAKHTHISPFTMQAIETYTLSLPNLHLTPFQSTNTIIDDVNPLNYCLTADDFISLTLPDSQLLYALDSATSTSLWWAPRWLTRVITRTAIHFVPFNPSLPVS